MSTNDQIKELHAAYCSISKQNIGLRYNRESSWIEFIRSGFTKADLEAVLKRLLKLVEQGERRLEALKFSNAIEQLDRFEEELALIRSEKEGFKTKGRELSVYELTKVIEAKRLEAHQLKTFYGREDSFGTVWEKDFPRVRYTELLTEIQSLQQRLSNLA